MDMVKEVFHPLLEVKTDSLATSHHSVYDSCILSCVMVAAEQIVLSSLCCHSNYVGIAVIIAVSQYIVLDNTT
jgi:hypothetical protein